MTKAEFVNWLAIYGATFICCLVSILVTVSATLSQVLQNIVVAFMGVAAFDAEREFWRQIIFGNSIARNMIGGPSAVREERPWTAARTVRAWLLLAAAIWWRWQKTYLLTTPVTLSIVTMFAFSLDWSR